MYPYGTCESGSIEQDADGVVFIKFPRKKKEMEDSEYEKLLSHRRVLSVDKQGTAKPE